MAASRLDEFWASGVGSNHVGPSRGWTTTLVLTPNVRPIFKMPMPSAFRTRMHEPAALAGRLVSGKRCGSSTGKELLIEVRNES
jgi:hypothetical protein